jgi:uncharacterized protein
MTVIRRVGWTLMALIIASCGTMPTGSSAPTPSVSASATPNATPSATPSATVLTPLSIVAMRQRVYPGSALTIEQRLAAGANYQQFIASYYSEGLKIYGLLTVPDGVRPATGWPVIIFNHGYIPPQQYRTTERYVAYVDAFARAGYIVFKSDYRGNGSSQGTPRTAYGFPDYTVDVLNAVTTLANYPPADPHRIGMWGHSMGGNITLRALVIDPRIKVAVIWAGVTATYQDILFNWHPPPGSGPPATAPGSNWRQRDLSEYGTPQQDPAFWNSIDPMAYLPDITAPIQIDHGTADVEVPLAFSQKLATQLQNDGKTVQFYTYPGSDHNIAQGFSLAMARSVAFFNQYLK